MLTPQSRRAGGARALGLCLFGAALAAACATSPGVRHGNSGGSSGSGGSAGLVGISGGSGPGSGGLIVPDGGNIDIIASELVFEPPSVTLVLDGSGSVETASYALIATLP